MCSPLVAQIRMYLPRRAELSACIGLSTICEAQYSASPLCITSNNTESEIVRYTGHWWVLAHAQNLIFSPQAYDRTQDFVQCQESHCILSLFTLQVTRLPYHELVIVLNLTSAHTLPSKSLPIVDAARQPYYDDQYRCLCLYLTIAVKCKQIEKAGLDHRACVEYITR
ncbi:hypothetical protein J6590_009539 [Homalodisca vitripennis]|nr:hypothetical protein J6590_009539 [Homalodisca vitripennis]